MTDRNDGADPRGGAVPPYGRPPQDAQPQQPPQGPQPPSGQQAPYGQPMPPPMNYPQQPTGYQQPAFAQPSYAQPPYAQPLYGQASYGQPAQGPVSGQGGALPLWAPLYGAGPVVAVKRFFQKYADFSGRASRSEYWWVALAFSVAFLALGVIGGIAGIPGSTTDYDGTTDPGPGFFPFAILIALLSFGSIIPSLSLGVRRLHDADLSGWLLLINFVPYLGAFVILILSLLGSKPGGARFDRPRA